MFEWKLTEQLSDKPDISFSKMSVIFEISGKESLQFIRAVIKIVGIIEFFKN